MKCPDLKLIVRHNHFRFVSYCGHGTIHIAWDWLTLHLQPQDFQRITHLLQKAGQDFRWKRISKGRSCVLKNQGDGLIQVWLGGTVLLLKKSEFLKFAQLVQAASQRIEEAWDDVVKPRSDINLHPAQTLEINAALPSLSFSRN